MDEMKDEDALRSMMKDDNGNNFGKITEEVTMEEVNTAKSISAETEIDTTKERNENASLETTQLNDKESISILCDKKEDPTVGSNISAFEEGMSHEMEESNTTLSDKINTIEIGTAANNPSSFELFKLDGEASILIHGGKEKEVLTKESDQVSVIEKLNSTGSTTDNAKCGEDLTEKAKNDKMESDNIGNVSKEETSFEPAKLNGAESILIPNSKEKGVSPEQLHGVIAIDKLNSTENTTDHVVHGEDSKEKVTNEEVKDISKNYKLNKKGRKRFKKKKALNGVHKQIIENKNGQELSVKEDCQTMLVSNNNEIANNEQTVKNAEQIDKSSNKKGKLRRRDAKKGKLKATNDQETSTKSTPKKDKIAAAGPGGYNIEPKAFNSAFPSQVRFSVYEDCLPLPEEKFKKAIKDNYYKKNKFDCQLTSEQVKNLCKLFQDASRGSKLRGLGRDIGAQSHNPVPRASHKAQNDGRSATSTDQKKNRKRLRGAGNSSKQDRNKKKHPCRGHDHAVEDQGRRRKKLRGAENHKYKDWDRDAERHRDAYEREAYAPLVLGASRPPLLPPTPALAFPPRSYAYERTLDINVHRRDPLIDHPDRQLLELDLRNRDYIELGKNSAPEHHEGRYLDSEFRLRGPVIDHPDWRLLEIESRNRDHIEIGKNPVLEHDGGRFLHSEFRRRGEIVHHDLPVYRDRLLYSDLSTSQPSEYHHHPRASLHHATSPQNGGLYYRYIDTRPRY